MSSEISEKIKLLHLSKHYEQWIKNKHIVGATLEVTSRCNFKCVHCYMCELREDSKQLNYNQIIKIIDILYENGVLFLTFSGGDPFVRSDFKDIYLYAKKKGFLVDIFSNGTLIDEDWVNLFKDFPPFLIDLSIYGASNETYEKVTGHKNAFDKFIRTLELLSKADIRFAIKAPLMSLNYKDIHAMRKIAERYSKENFRFSYDIVPDRNNNVAPRSYALDPLEAVLLEISDQYNVEALRQTAEDRQDWNVVIDKYGCVPVHFCSIGDSSVHIDYLGNVAPCIECSDRQSIFNVDFADICADFDKYKKIKSTPNYRCIGCNAVMFCMSCPQVRKRLYGDAEVVKDSDCIVAKLKYKYYVDKLSVQELKSYYQKYLKEVES